MENSHREKQDHKKVEEKAPAQAIMSYRSSSLSRAFMGLLALTYFLRTGSGLTVTPALVEIPALSPPSPDPFTTPPEESLKSQEHKFTNQDVLDMWDEALQDDDTSKLEEQNIFGTISGEPSAQVARPYAAYIFQCAEFNRPNLLAWLLQEGGGRYINAKDDASGETALMASIRSSSKEAFDILVNATGCNLTTTKSNSPYTALKAAVQNPDPYYLKALLEKGAKPDTSEFITPLTLAAGMGHFEHVRILVENNAYDRKRDGKAALDVAVRRGGAEDKIAVYLRERVGQESTLNVYWMGALLVYVLKVIISKVWADRELKAKNVNNNHSRELKAKEKKEAIADRQETPRFLVDKNLITRLHKLQKSANGHIAKNATDILKEINTGASSPSFELNRYVEQVKKLEDVALQQKRAVEENLKDYLPTKLKLEKLEKEIKGLGKTFGDDRTIENLQAKIKTANEILEKCIKLQSTLNDRIFGNPYDVNKDTDRDYLEFQSSLEQFKQLEKELQVSLCQARCRKLYEDLSGNPAEKKLEKNDSKILINKFDTAIRAAKLKRHKIALKLQSGYDARVEKAGITLSNLENFAKDLEAFDMEMRISYHTITESRIQVINSRIAEIADLLPSANSQLDNLRSSLPPESSMGFVGQRISKKSMPEPNLPVRKPDQKESEDFILSLQLEEQKSQRVGLQFSDIANVAKDYHRAIEINKESKDSKKSKEIDLQYYSRIGVIHFLAKRILNLKLSEKFKKDPAWTKIQNIYKNLTEHPGLLADYNLLQVEDACKEFLEMIGNANKTPPIPAPFNTAKSPLLRKLWSKDDLTVSATPPYVDYLLTHGLSQYSKSNKLLLRPASNYLGIILPKYQTSTEQVSNVLQ